MTIAETSVQNALYELWYDFYTQPLTTTERNELVEEFTEKWLDSAKIKIDKPAYYHPMNRLKQRYDQPPVTASDILADFILRASEVSERGEQYPIHNAESDLTREDKRKKEEVGLFSDELDAEAGERVPSGYITEAVAVAEMYIPKTPPTVDEYREELARVKKYAGYYASTVHEVYGYDEADALRRIKALKLDRVKECRVCGGGFYARNMRREVCDQQHGIMVGGGRSKESACELIDMQSYQKNYYVITKMGLKKSIV